MGIGSKLNECSDAFKYGLKKDVNILLRIYTVIWFLWAAAVTLVIIDVPPEEGTSIVENVIIYTSAYILMIILPFMPIYWVWNRNALNQTGTSYKNISIKAEKVAIPESLEPISKIKPKVLSKAELEGDNAIKNNPNILVSITSSKGFKVGIWEKLDVNILNVGEGAAKEIELKLSGPLETNGNKVVHALDGNGGQTDIVIGIKPKEPGNIPLKIEVVFFNQKGKSYEMREEAFISVAKESETISIQQTPVINIGHIDRSTKIIDSMIQRSNIGTGARKCPNCGREVDANETFCKDCGAKL